MEISAGLAGSGAGRPGLAAEAAGPGRSGPPGQLAKQAVAAARALGAELPSNAQGLAASAIARGADPASVFAAQIAAVTPAPADTATPPGAEPAYADGGPDGTAPPADDPATAETTNPAPPVSEDVASPEQVVADNDAVTAPPITDGVGAPVVADGAGIALALLTEGEG